MAKATKITQTTTEPDPSLPQVTTEVTKPEVTEPEVAPAIKTFVEDAPPPAEPDAEFGPVVSEPKAHAPVPQIEQTEVFLSATTLAEMQRGRESIASR